MKIGIGIELIVFSSVLFTLLVLENTPWVLATLPLFLTGFLLVCLKVDEMEKDITCLKEELKKFINKEQKKEAVDRWNKRED